MNYNIPPKLLDYLTQSKVIQDKVNDTVLFHIEDACLRYKDVYEYDELIFNETVIDTVKKYKEIKTYSYYLDMQLKKKLRNLDKQKMIEAYKEFIAGYFNRDSTIIVKNLKSLFEEYHRMETDEMKQSILTEYILIYQKGIGMINYHSVLMNFSAETRQEYIDSFMSATKANDFEQLGVINVE